MNPRERFRRFLHFDPQAGVPNIDHGPLLSTYERWLGEGLRSDLDPRRYDEWCDAIGLDRYPTAVSWSLPSQPLFRQEVLEETETTVTIRRGDGSVIQDNKGSHKTIPRDIRPAVTCRGEWDRIKAWMNVDAPVPAGDDDPKLAEALALARESEHPVWLRAGSLVGMPRNLLGFEAFAMLAYDDPVWLEDMIETHCRAAEWQIRLFGQNAAPVDGVHLWEDICFKNGPIMNPEHFRRLAVPRYRRLAELAASFGCDRLSVDSDGDIRPLIDPWLDGGVTVLWPLEVQAGMDINDVQARWGRRSVWIGAVHKGRLPHGEAAIRAELQRVAPAVHAGGYLPALDHCCPPDVSLENYFTYLRLRHEILHLGGRPVDPASILA